MQALDRESYSVQDIKKQALSYLSRREYGITELRIKLLNKFDSRLQIDQTLEVLQNEDLLNENRYVQSYIQSRVNKGYGPERIRMELMQKGIAMTLVDKAFFKCGVDWHAEIQKVWSKKYRSAVSKDLEEIARQWRFLQYRGFPTDMIKRVLKKVV